ncbi:hypothetical protein FISHEDRAFT_35228 [Fistulina hepatica ATCC 64428]|uniref:Uncharacterized protein n=1 Tax=Fistulina hepatica ATCC 64428 TaxID=1128425 RepID=A0A0D7ANW7_9AGAR|nr:hypothetical protein FISHEDRAFT_35228 [Fistulina hepatica ATCC 64428]
MRLGGFTRSNLSSYRDTLSTNQRALFDYAIEALDANWAPPFLFQTPRYSAWYAVGLLARNEGDDAALASRMIADLVFLHIKWTDPTKIWYGTYKDDPQQPDPSAVFPPQIYTSYDPNVGLFVCTSWIIIMEEFQDLLSPALIESMKQSMYIEAVGAGYRVGGYNGDNLYPVYSNPWYMRVMVATYVGNMMSDANMSYWGNEWAREAIEYFDIYDTLSEFNSGTYTGVTLYALSLWGYMPANATIVSRAPDIIAKTWSSVGQFWNPTLKTLGGPWDRAYGWYLKDYFGILGGWATGLVGGIEDNNAPIPEPLIGCEHVDDVAAAVLTPLIAKFHDPYVPEEVRAQLTSLNGSHSYFAQAVSPPFDNPAYPRNYTSWTEDGLSVGGVQLDQREPGGAALSPYEFAPAVILWTALKDETAYFMVSVSCSPGRGGKTQLRNTQHFATSGSISAVASSTNLTIAYPPSRAFPDNSTTSDIMTFLISGITNVTLPGDFLSNGSSYDLPGLRLSVSGNVASGSTTLLYGASPDDVYNYYNFTYTIPENLTDTPVLVLSYEKLPV